ncbi:hypothetical protein [Okibacterium fritillariae]|nr:hypothetical protein [Okibacterium fritillariae]
MPATVAILSGIVEPALVITLILAVVFCVDRGRAALKEPSRYRFALGLDSILFLVAGLLTLVVLGSLASPGDSKLFRLGLSGFSGADVVPSYLIILWCISLATLPIPRGRGKVTSAFSRLEARTAIAMGLMGAVGLALSLTVSRFEVFSNRGETTGNGLNSLLYWAAAAFVSYVITAWRRGDGKLYLFAAAAASLGLLATGNRSPLALIAIAVVVRIIADHRTKLFLVVALSVPIGLLVFAYQSAWRSRVSHGLPSGPIDVLSAISANPTQEFLRLGFDTVEGHTLVSRILEAGYDARWLDPLLAVTNFVPRALWEGKPVLLGSEIGNQYLGLSAGGIFLSGPGYFALVTGSVALGAIVFVAFILGLRWLASRPSLAPIGLVAVFYLTIRIVVAGDAFDIFLSVQIFAIFLIARGLGWLLPWSR